MKILTEKEAESFLEKRGFNVAKRKIIKNPSELDRLKLEFPWVMKISSRRIIHKARIGGTVINIKNIRQAKAAFKKLKKLKGNVLVQEQADGQELILGLKQTPEFGIVIMVGAGGTDVEEVRDISFRVAPITPSDAREMLSEINIKVKHLKLVVSNLMKLSALAIKHPHIKEFDINPILVDKKEAIVVDARAVI